jgi:hypothetical protein
MGTNRRIRLKISSLSINKTTIIGLIPFFILALQGSGCSDKCISEPPTATLKVSIGSLYSARLEIIDSDGKSILTNNFTAAGSSSNLLKFNPGLSTYRITINNPGRYQQVQKTFSFNSCNDYDINVGVSSTLITASISAKPRGS